MKAKADEEYTSRFWENVDQHGRCWLWTGKLNWNGYGVTYARLNGQIHYRAHRHSWAIHNGPIPDGKVIAHECDNRFCVNPDHLFLTNQYENCQDQKRKDRQPLGERHGRAKLNEDIVKRIRKSRFSDTAWARRLGVHPTTIGNARNGSKWGHVE